MKERIEDPPEEKGLYTCPNGKFPHYFLSITAPIFIVTEDKSLLVGMGITCDGSVYNEATGHHDDCWMGPKKVKRFKAWPYEINIELFKRLAEKGPTYFHQWGWNLTKLANGLWINAKEAAISPRTKHTEPLDYEPEKPLRTLPGKTLTVLRPLVQKNVKSPINDPRAIPDDLEEDLDVPF